MPRRPRVHLDGIPLHIVQHGHNRGIMRTWALLVLAKQISNDIGSFAPFLDTYGYPRAKALLLRAAR